MSNTPIKDRLQERLKPTDIMIVKQALYGFLAKNDPEIKKVKFDNIPLERLLPHLQEFSQSWETVDKNDFNCSFGAINSLYHTIRNQFKNLDTLKKRIQEHKEEFGVDDTESEQDSPPKQMTTRKQDMQISSNVGTRGRP